MDLRNLLGLNRPEQTPPNKAPSDPSRNAATVREELALAQEGAVALTEKASITQREMEDSRRRYDGALHAFAIGAGQEPSRGELEVIVTKSDALHRIAGDQRKHIAALKSELATKELAEAIADGRERLPALISIAETRLGEFEAAAAAVKLAENALFAALFDERSGLRQRFANAELAREASRSRRPMAQQALKAAQRSGYRINPDFETDGERNLGASEDWRDRVAWARSRTPDAPRFAPGDVGELITEALDHAVTNTKPVVTW